MEKYVAKECFTQRNFVKRMLKTRQLGKDVKIIISICLKYLKQT